MNSMVFLGGRFYEGFGVYPHFYEGFRTLIFMRVLELPSVL